MEAKLERREGTRMEDGEEKEEEERRAERGLQ
jgi:hypothetical protein